MICRVVVICWRQSAAWSDRGRLRRHMQGIRAAWKMKYLRLRGQLFVLHVHAGQRHDTYKAYHAAMRPCSQLTQ